MRVSCWPLLLLPLLAACDPEIEPAKVQPPTQALPVTPSSAPEVVPPRFEAKPAAEPAQVTPAPESRDAGKAPQPAKAASRGQPAASHEDDNQAAALDLSLPPSLVERLNSVERDGESTPAPLLPPLFEAPDKDSEPVSLSGRLITDEAEADALKSVDGVELKFEVRR